MNSDLLPEYRKAGELIFANFRMFNQSTVLFENVINELFDKGFNQCVEQFTGDSGWENKYQKGNWIAPKSWANESGKKKYKAQFDYYNDSEGNDYLLADYTGTGSVGTTVGFCFSPKEQYFSAITHDKFTVNPACVEELKALGFHQDKNEFIIPVRLDIAQVLACWRAHGEFPAEDAVFAPLRAVLGVLLQATEIFDKLLKDAETFTRQKMSASV